MPSLNITIYTDGSYSPAYDIGSWAAILLLDDTTIELSGIATNTSHNKMELTAILQSIEYLDKGGLISGKVHFITDSQYAAGLPERKERLQAANFITHKGSSVRNADLVKNLFHYLDQYTIDFEKVKAHARNGDFMNRKVDKTARAILRSEIKKRCGLDDVVIAHRPS